MIHLIFESVAHKDFSDTDLAGILQHARARNRADDVTGLLVYHDGVFVQVLEGPDAAVEACFERIKDDPRHGEIWEIARYPAQKRSFQSWCVGMSEPSRMPSGMTYALNDLGLVRARMRDLSARRPYGAGAYTSRVFRSFLRSLDDLGWQ